MAGTLPGNQVQTKMWQNNVFMLWYIYVDLGFYSTTTLLSPLNMVQYCQQTKSHDAL